MNTYVGYVVSFFFLFFFRAKRRNHDQKLLRKTENKIRQLAQIDPCRNGQIKEEIELLQGTLGHLSKVFLLRDILIVNQSLKIPFF